MSKRREHTEWKQRVARGMPHTAARVFALRGKPYMGSGFHYSLEAQLGSVLRIVNTFEYEDVGTQVINEVIVEGFYKCLIEAEESLNG